MKLSYLTAGALILSAAACGRFGEVTVDIEALDANKVVQLTRNGAQFPATIVNIEFELANGVLVGAKQGDVEIFDAIQDDFDLGDEVKNQVDAGDLVIKADKLYDDFQFELVAVRYLMEADLNNNGVVETEITVEVEDINEVFEFNNLGVNSFKQNIQMILQLDPKGILDGADIQQLVIDQAVNVNAAVLDQVLLIDADNAPDEIDTAIDNITNLDKQFAKFVYNIKAQQVRVKAQ